MRLSLPARLATLSVAAALVSITGCANQDSSPGATASTNTGRPLTETTSDPSAKSDGQKASAAMKPMQESLAYPTGDPRTSAVLLEKSGPSQIRVGQPYEYQLKVTNLTDAPLAGVAVKERMGEGFTIGQSSVQPAQQDGQNVYAIGELAPKESKTITVSGTAKGAGEISSCTSVAYNPTLCTTAMVIAPQIGIAKAGPAQADICEPILYKYTVSNTGTGTETDVRVEDKLPEGLLTADGKNVVSFVVDEVPQGKSREFEVRLKADRTGDFGSQASATSPGGTVQSENVATKVIAPELKLALTGPEQEYVGKSVTYNLSVQNTGSAPAKNATVAIDGAGSDATLAAVGAEGNNDAQPAAARIGADGGDLGEIAPGQTRQYRVTVPAAQAGTLSVNAVAKARCAADATAVASTEIRTIPALLLEVVDREDPIRVNENTVYTVRVTNQGSGPDRNIGITALLPAELQYVRATGATEAQAQGQQVRFNPVSSLEPGKTVQWEIEVKALKAGDVRFQLDMNSDSLGKNVTETEATRLY